MKKKSLKEVTVNSHAIRKRFEILKKINDFYREYNNLQGVRRISTTDFESHYGEYLVASKLIDEGFRVEVANKKGYDIKVDSQRIEVKTSRPQRRIREGKHVGWGWVVKKSQWDPQGFDFLVCVACERSPGRDEFLAFSYSDVKECFTKGSWTYQKFRKEVRDYLRLSLYRDGIDAFHEDLEVLRKEIGLTENPTSFEEKLNEDPTYAFDKYSWREFVNKLTVVCARDTRKGRPLSASESRRF